MFGQLRGKLAPAPWVLVLKLHAGRASRIDLCNGRHALAPESFGDVARVLLEALALARHRAIATSSNHQGSGSGGMAQPRV
jgi:hypothetical protein